MRVLHVTPTYYPATYWGGPIVSVHSLCNALASMAGVDLKVLTIDTAGPRISERVEIRDFPTRYPGGYDVYFTRQVMGREIAPGLLVRLWTMVKWADVVHLTATYSFPTIPTLFICRMLNKPLVWSPRGALQAAHNWGSASKPTLKKMWEYVCRVVMPKQYVLHVTSDAEMAASTARLGKAEAVAIPNGVDVPNDVRRRKWMPDGTIRLIYIGRLAPIKGIENLVRAFSQLNGVPTTLNIYGTGERKYVDSLVELARLCRADGRLRFCGHVEGKAKTKAFLEADVCVVPSHSENFGMVVAESLAHGVPVIASKGTPWESLVEHRSGLWVANDPTTLASAITHMRTCDLEGMGRNGRAWMKREFCWQDIAGRMLAVYEQLIAG